MPWKVQLVGDSADLTMLAETQALGGLCVEAQGNEFLLASASFEELESAGAVRERAQELVAALSGASRLQLGTQVKLRVGTVYMLHSDGTRDVTVFPEVGALTVRGFAPTISIGRPDGSTEVHRPADVIASWMPLAEQYSEVAKALRLRNNDELKWVELNRIYEVIRADVGSQITDRGWSNRSTLERFTRTANSVAAVGDDARHGHERTEPPPHPLSLIDARTLIDTLLRHWLEWKARHNASST